MAYHREVRYEVDECRLPDKGSDSWTDWSKLQTSAGMVKGPWIGTILSYQRLLHIITYYILHIKKSLPWKSICEEESWCKHASNCPWPNLSLRLSHVLFIICRETSHQIYLYIYLDVWLRYCISSRTRMVSRSLFVYCIRSLLLELSSRHFES